MGPFSLAFNFVHDLLFMWPPFWDSASFPLVLGCGKHAHLKCNVELWLQRGRVDFSSNAVHCNTGATFGPFLPGSARVGIPLQLIRRAEET